MITRPLLKAILRVLIRVLLRVQIEGLERVPRTGPLLVMINHINFVDGPLVLGLMPRDTIAMTKQELFRNPILGPLAWLYGVFPVRRGEVDRRALARAEKTLVGGTALLFSPEGHRSGHGRLQPAKKGIAYVALRTNASILPVAVTGQERFWRNIVRLRRTDVHVEFGQPLRVARTQELSNRQLLREITTQVMYKLAALLPPQYRGEYHDLDEVKKNRFQLLQPLDA